MLERTSQPRKRFSSLVRALLRPCCFAVDDVKSRDACIGRFKCSCSGSPSTSYERLSSYLELRGLGASPENLESNQTEGNKDKQEVVFYNDDGSYQTAVVERNLCASDLCQLLALKNRASRDANWCIVEHWPDLGLERCLEDHEDIWNVINEPCRFSDVGADRRYIFRKDFRKYDYFHNPTQFFPPDMVDLSGYEDLSLNISNCSPSSNSSALQSLLIHAGESPPIFSHVWVREAHKQVWSNAFLLLRDKKLYLSYKIQVVAKFLRSWKNKDNTVPSNKERSSSPQQSELQVLANLSDVIVYTTLNARNQLRAPTEWGLCLKPITVTNNSFQGVFPVSSTSSAVGLASATCLACESDRARLAWLTAMRIAKYGKQLRENYRAFKNKHLDSVSPKDYNSYTVPNESVRSRVAMDFTGSVGRIVEEPNEARAIQRQGPRHPPHTRHNLHHPPLHHHQVAAHALAQAAAAGGPHLSQPWFHQGMTRDNAARLVTRHGNVDGVFLVRDSRSNPGSFVLTFKSGGKVMHTQIQPVIDPVRESVCYSLDNGATKFYDLLQLVEFYQLNAGCLPTRLTHCVVQNQSGSLSLYTDNKTRIPASF